MEWCRESGELGEWAEVQEKGQEARHILVPTLAQANGPAQKRSGRLLIAKQSAIAHDEPEHRRASEEVGEPRNEEWISPEISRDDTDSRPKGWQLGIGQLSLRAHLFSNANFTRHR